MRSSDRTLAVLGLVAMSLVVGIGVAVREQFYPTVDAERVLPPPARRAIDVPRRPPPPELNAAPADHVDAALPASLRETEIDGWLGVDDEGHVVVTPGARWFFDYFLSATGEEAPEDIRARLIDEIERRLPPMGAREAIALLDRYLSYRERVRSAQASGPAGDLEHRLAELHAIRVATFGASDAAILFGEEEQVQTADLRRRAVMSDPTLVPEERERRLSEIEQQLPPAVRAARADTFAPLHLMQDEQALRDAGGSPDDIHTLREQRFGADAAERLAALDREQAAWQQRVEDYRHARRLIEGDAALDEQARTHALDALIAQRFTQQERARVEALEQLHSRGTASSPNGLIITHNHHVQGLE